MELMVDGYIVWNDRNRNGGGVGCYIRNNICCKRKACMFLENLIWIHYLKTNTFSISQMKLKNSIKICFLKEIV